MTFCCTRTGAFGRGGRSATGSRESSKRELESGEGARANGPPLSSVGRAATAKNVLVELNGIEPSTRAASGRVPSNSSPLECSPRPRHRGMIVV